VKNIERLAALVNGSIVQPGEQYSLNEHSGLRTAANGFVAGPTIVEGEMEMTVGGGVSQFATTMFNAAFDGGYEIIQRQAHTYWFPRYPEGYDATLGFPLPDLVFRNDTASAIFIKTEVGRNFVRVEFYGDNGGRKVERHVSPRFDIVKPETVLEPNPGLLPDETKVLFGGWIGWSLHVSRTITFPDGQKKEERRKVTYSPRARRVETHPCKIPEGAPGYTGEKCPKIEVPDGGAN
jgi:vancomycin resistance protein YoaR